MKRVINISNTETGVKRTPTKLGGGMALNPVHPITGTLDFITEIPAHEFGNVLRENLNQISCTKGITTEINPAFRWIEEHMESDADERELYYYHGDHLGSSSWITDASGNVNQHLAYMAYGEDFVNERSGRDIRFKSTGKERDSETGMDYFGARYYLSDLSIWASVDPLSDKYPSLSPYMYCAGNPVILIDPDGKRIDVSGILCKKR